MKTRSVSILEIKGNLRKVKGRIKPVPTKGHLGLVLGGTTLVKG